MPSVSQLGDKNTMAGLSIHLQPAVSGHDTLLRGPLEARNCPGTFQDGQNEDVRDG